MDIANKIDFEELAETLKVLGHPIRLKIVCGLLSENACVTDIYKCLSLPQATVSQHLSLLRNKNIVKSVRQGVKMRYKVVNEDIIKIVRALLEAK